MGRSFYTLSALIGFLAGVLLYLAAQPVPAVLFSVMGFAALGCFVRSFRIFAIVIIALSLGFLRAGMTEHRVTPESIDFYNGQKIEFEALVTQTDVRRDAAKYTLSVRGGKQGDVLISLPKYPQYRYGDVVRVSGELLSPGEFDGFSYDHYLARYGIYSVMYRPEIEVLARGQGSLFWRGMAFLQDAFLARINRLFPEPHGSFEAGLLVGARKGIPPDLMEKFNITGLSHIIAISGYNITIIIAFVMWLLRGLPRRVGFAVSVAAIVLFTLFVGASPAVTRASVMGVLGLLALHSGRQNSIHLTILWSAFFMVLYNPKILWWDVGFQLSFAAVMGLVYVAPLFEKAARKLPEAFGIREAITMTLSAQVMALPIIVFNFGRLSLIAPLSNLLVAFAIPPAMLLGFLAVAASFLFYPLGLFMAYPAWGVLSYIIGVIHLTGAVPYASVNVPGLPAGVLFLYYIFLAAFLYARFRRQKILASPLRA